MSSPRSSSSKRNSSELDSEHAQKVPEADSGQQQVKLKERQKFFEEAFQQDMEHYLSTSYLQIAERRGSMSSMEVNVDMLEQMDLMDMSDHEALDVSSTQVQRTTVWLLLYWNPTWSRSEPKSGSRSRRRLS
ncbi:hypothetical protein HF521_015727 [Silurus meridionalis]|uniref:Dystrobrevin binding protein 1b n=1 Tax=Silurus meridionalis TaxID=175797 RepID=A0A8T0A3Q1_SILME|nr:hypothetical protein HF521_015727 [Silurus meridionalis]